MAKYQFVHRLSMVHTSGPVWAQASMFTFGFNVVCDVQRQATFTLLAACRMQYRRFVKCAPPFGLCEKWRFKSLLNFSVNWDLGSGCLGWDKLNWLYSWEGGGGDAFLS